MPDLTAEAPTRRRSTRPRHTTTKEPAEAPTHRIEPVLTRRQARARASTHKTLSTPAHTTPRDQQPRDARSNNDTVAPGDGHPPIDPFEAAARLFSFTSAPATEDATEKSASSTRGIPPEQERHVGASATVRRRSAGLRAAFLSARIVGLVGVLTIGMTVDAEALPHEHDDTVSTPRSALSEDIQAYVTSAEAGTDVSLSRDSYSTGTLVDLAGTAGIVNYSDAVFRNDPTCAVQWPYAVGVPVTYGFGMRSGKMHEGTDFVPGAGAHIQAVADGVVRVATDNGGAFGVTIVIDHVIDGQTVSSRYAHMEYDSRQVEVGDTVRVGQYIGRTGDTGRSFGAHLHFEVLQGGTTATDPLLWLRAHAVC